MHNYSIQTTKQQSNALRNFWLYNVWQSLIDSYGSSKKRSLKSNMITNSQVARFDTITAPNNYPQESAQQLSYYNLFAKMFRRNELKIIIIGTHYNPGTIITTRHQMVNIITVCTMSCQINCMMALRSQLQNKYWPPLQSNTNAT